jgi:hypothetical protein
LTPSSGLLPMPTAVKLPNRCQFLPGDDLHTLKELTTAFCQHWDFRLGHVGSLPPSHAKGPDEFLWHSLEAQVPHALELLNGISKDRHYLPSICFEPSLVFGEGSVNSHTDNITNETLLTVLWGRGELFCDGTSYELQPGDWILFDDRVKHAWLANGKWCFFAQPLTHYSK